MSARISEGGPFLVAALFCREARLGANGQLDLEAVATSKTYSAPPSQVEARLVLIVQAGCYHGAVALGIRPFTPTDPACPNPESEAYSMLFDAAVRWRVYPFNFSVPFHGAGVYGAEIYLNGELVTRSEFQIALLPGLGSLPRMGLRPLRD